MRRRRGGGGDEKESSSSRDLRRHHRSSGAGGGLGDGGDRKRRDRNRGARGAEHDSGDDSDPGSPPEMPRELCVMKKRCPKINPKRHYLTQPHTQPRPCAPETAPETKDAWTKPVVSYFRRQADYCQRLAVSYWKSSRKFRNLNIWRNVVIALSTAGMVGVIAIDENGFDWIGYVLAVIVFIFLGMNTAMNFDDQVRLGRMASLELRSMSQNICAVLNQPFDERPNPYHLAVGVNRRISDIVAMAEGDSIELAPDIFTNDPYD